MSLYILIKDSVGLKCGHSYCTDCCREYLTSKIMEENATNLICCPDQNCEKIVHTDIIMQVVSDANVSQKYQSLMINNFVQVNCLSSSFHLVFKSVSFVSFEKLCDFFSSTILCCVGAHRRIVNWSFNPSICWAIDKIVNVRVVIDFASIVRMNVTILYHVKCSYDGKVATKKRFFIYRWIQNNVPNASQISRKILVVTTW